MGTLLADETADRIRAAARDALDEECRSITYFTRDDYEQLYLREDLERDADLSEFIGHEWRGFRTARAAYEGSELGEYQYTIRAFDNGYLIRVTTEKEGVFVTTDELPLADFESAAEALHEQLPDPVE